MRALPAARRNRWAYLAAALALVATIVAASWFFFNRQAPPGADIRSVAVLSLQSLRDDETDKTIALDHRYAGYAPRQFCVH